MEAVAALAFACNVVELVQLAGKVISKTKEIHDSVNGMPKEIESIKHLADSLSLNSEDVQQKSLQYKQSNESESSAEKRLLDLSKQSISIAQEVSRRLNFLRVKESKNTWKSFKVAVQSMLSKKEMDHLKEKLENLRKEINTTLLFCIR
jgi:uncharacterized protein YoxC